ncbi:Tryptophan 2-halogenase [Mycena venus]|uniref:Tryptophan 2-halogenase n=1 Tax=Mycena venus TaxID=2733690 RepID=A0A8H6TWD0_9AGAR|nr:Tryptophan 2-halogenase [Mycena venus]
MPPSPPTPQQVLGPYYFGALLSTFLYGILVLQTLTYYQGYKKDKIWLRLFYRTGICIAMIYEPLVGQFVGAICTAVIVAQVKVYLEKPKVNLIALIWCCSAAGADVAITASLIWSLRARKTGLKNTDDTIDRIVRNTIQTGAITVAFTLTNTLLFVGLSSTLSACDFVFDFAVPKLYSNALISTLNARTNGTDGGMMELRTSPTSRNHLVSDSRPGKQRASSATQIITSSDIAFNKPSSHDLFLETKSDILALGTGDSYVK